MAPLECTGPLQQVVRPRFRYLKTSQTLQTVAEGTFVFFISLLPGNLETNQADTVIQSASPAIDLNCGMLARRCSPNKRCPLICQTTLEIAASSWHSILARQKTHPLARVTPRWEARRPKRTRATENNRGIRDKPHYPFFITRGLTPGSGTGLLLRRTAERKSTFEAWPTLSVPVPCNRLLDRPFLYRCGTKFTRSKI